MHQHALVIALVKALVSLLQPPGASSKVVFPLWTKWLVTNPMPTQYWHELLGFFMLAASWTKSPGFFSADFPPQAVPQVAIHRSCGGAEVGRGKPGQISHWDVAHSAPGTDLSETKIGWKRVVCHFLNDFLIPQLWRPCFHFWFWILEAFLVNTKPVQHAIVEGWCRPGSNQTAATTPAVLGVATAPMRWTSGWVWP